MSISMADFDDPSFDVKPWVNAACAGCPDDESVEKFLAEVEMKLQLAAEDISLALEEQSNAGLNRIPRAVAEIDRVEHDTKALQTRVQGILKRLNDAEGSSRESVRRLTRVDAVKGRMEAARDTLREAAGLAELMASVEDVFAAGNVRSMADVLASMRRALKVVGGVPEFQDAPEKVDALERRLEQILKPELVKALTASDAIKAEEIRDVLKITGRLNALTATYAETRVVAPMLREWNAFHADGVEDESRATPPSAADVRRFVEWLPGYARKLHDRLQRELQWTRTAFPKEHGALVSSAWIALSRRVNKAFALRMSSNKLETFIAAHAAAGEGFARCATLLADVSGVEASGAALIASLAPFDAVHARYGELETKTIADAVDAARATPESDDIDAVVAAFKASTAAAMEALAEPRIRCIALTAGASFPALLTAVDAGLARHLTGMMRALRKLRRATGPGAGGSPGTGGGDVFDAGAGREAFKAAPGEESVISSLELATVAAAAATRATALADELLESARELAIATRDALPLAAPGPASGKGTGKGEAPPAAAPVAAKSADDLTPAFCAVASNPARAAELRNLLERVASDARFKPLPLGLARASALEDAANQFVLDVLASKVRNELRGMRGRAEWGETRASGGLNLPTFSAYPQEYMTNAGEYLLSLPTTLDAIAGAGAVAGAAGPGGADDVPELDAGEWMAKVAAAAASLLLTEVRGISALTDLGAAQLAADLDYFVNVIAALSLDDVPDAKKLRCFATCCAAARDAYVMSTRDGDAVDEDIVKIVAAARGIKLGGGGGANRGANGGAGTM
ncbi:uncharacterized protein MICPUCDRAFT_30910 [Micromonas pusilla CCMP1545]|uniref:Conserved oligomeric Golgi complex subunit 7 n=1 Tax=Micromonas pusilla (strain CCMP1545) TaxID=564608 RepID=C1MHU8_MICPC|nr:uncharacterized protein MICPUCDRAFT_30910 [Micromonas pusilla CCMP1545]EEH60806.1 predicted protein [Micromonas pusilla CCMP1545]|eukprot:XP_003055554.1 predicted protein [Micromonas pusilla CCMP1545]